MPRRRRTPARADRRPDGAAGGAPKDDVVDAEFTEVDDDKKKVGLS